MIESDLDEILRRRNLADFYYDNYQKHYRAKEYSKASEFLWGTINNLAYIIGLFYDRKIRNHGEVVSFIKDLANIMRESKIITWLASAERLHANFFHDFMDQFMFEDDKDKAEKLIETLSIFADKEIQKLFRPK